MNGFGALFIPLSLFKTAYQRLDCVLFLVEKFTMFGPTDRAIPFLRTMS
jgi:hypothetical protein